MYYIKFDESGTQIDTAFLLEKPSDDGWYKSPKDFDV